MTASSPCVLVGEPLKAVMDDGDLMRVLDLKKSRFYELKRQGCFDLFIVRRLGAREPRMTPGPGRRGTTRYSGALIQKWLEGGGTPQSQFGLRRSKAAR